MRDPDYGPPAQVRPHLQDLGPVFVADSATQRRIEKLEAEIRTLKRRLELASLVIDLTGSGSRIVHQPLPADDPRQRQPDISRANELLGWAPRIELREGLMKTIAYFDGLLSASSEGISPA